MTAPSHSVVNTDGHTIEVLTADDLRSWLAGVLRWLIGTGIGLVVVGSVWATKVESRLTSVRTDSDSSTARIARIEDHGSRPVRDLNRDLDGLKAQIGALTQTIETLRADVVSLRVAVARRRGGP